MNQECAIDSRPTLSSTISPRLGTLLPFLSLLAISSVPLLVAATDAGDARYNDLGHRIMCTCKSEPASGVGVASPCKQVVLECTHDNCEVSRHMRRELSAALQKGDTDNMVLDSFVKEYGTSVLVVPRMSDIPTRIWVLASVVLFVLAASIALAFVRRRHLRRAMAATSPSDSRHIDPDLLRRVRQSTDEGT